MHATDSPIYQLTSAVQAMAGLTLAPPSGSADPDATPAAAKVELALQALNRISGSQWHTLADVRAATTLSNQALLEGLRVLVHHRVVMTSVGPAGGEQRYRVENDAARDRTKIGIQVVDLSSRVTVDGLQATPQKSSQEFAQPELPGTARGAVARDSRGHFVRRQTESPATVAQVPPRHQVTEYAMTQTIAPGQNRIRRLRFDAIDTVVVELERRPGSTGVHLSLEDAVKLGQDALKVLHQQTLRA